LGGQISYSKIHRFNVDNPGEFYRDQKNSRIYVWAFGGGNPGQYKIEIPKHFTFRIQTPSSYIRIKGLVIKNSFLKNSGGGVQIGDHCIVEDCVFYHNRWGIVNGWPAATDVKILNNEFYECGDGVINWEASGGLIKGNVSHDNWDDGIALRGCSDFIIEENISFNNLGGGPAGNEGDGIKCCHVFGQDPHQTAARNCIIRNNLCYNNREDAMVLGGYNLQVYNNTMIGGDYGLILYGSNNIVKNNIIQGQFTLGNFGITDISSNDIDYNLWYRPEGNFYFTNLEGTYYRSLEELYAATGWGQHSLFADPKFVNPKEEDFHLQSTSPAINSGLHIPIVTNDIEGNTRPQESGYDMGAYEFGGQTDSIPPNPPRELTSPNQTFNSIELVWRPPEQAEDGDYASSYQIWRDDVLINTVYDTFFIDVGLNEATAYNYKIYSLDKAGNQSVDAAIGLFSTFSDTIPPAIVAVRPRGLENVLIVFTEPVELTSAETTTNYEITNGINVLAAELQADKISVLLTTDPLQLGVNYTVTVGGVKDLSVNGNVIASSTQTSFRLLADYFDDFEDGDADGWQPQHVNRWMVTSDEGDKSYFLNTSDYDSPAGLLLGEYTLLEDSLFNNRDFEFTCWAKSAEDLRLNNNADHAVLFAFQDAQNYCYVQLHAYDVILCQLVNADTVLFLHPSANIPITNYHKIGIRFNDDTVRVSVNNELILEAEIVGVQPGRIGLGSYNDSAYFDDVNIEVLGVKHSDYPPAPPTGVSVRP